MSQLLYIQDTNSIDNKTNVFDSNSGFILGQIFLHSFNPVFSSDGEYYYGIYGSPGGGQKIRRYNTADGSLSAASSFTFPYTVLTGSIGISHSENFLYVIEEWPGAKSKIYKIDRNTLSVLSTSALLPFVHSGDFKNIIIKADDSEMYLYYRDFDAATEGVAVVNTSTLSITHQYPYTDGTYSGRTPYPVALSVDESSLFVWSESSSLRLLNLSTGLYGTKVPGTFSSIGPDGVCFNNNRTTAYIVQISSPSSLRRIDIATMSVTHTVNISGAYRCCLSADESEVFLGRTSTGIVNRYNSSNLTLNGVTEQGTIPNSPLPVTVNAEYTQAPPTISSVSPSSGNVIGGTAVTIVGSRFTIGTRVFFSGVEATSVVVSSSTSISCVAPPHSAGFVDVTVQRLDGQAYTKTNSFRYFAPAPSISGFSPTSGKVGDTVTINGSNLTGATVHFYNFVEAEIVSNTDTTIVVTVPPGSSTGKITVDTAGGMVQTAGDFTFIPAPVVDTITPDKGFPLQRATINGSYLTGSSVSFPTGGVASIISNTDTQIVVVIPAGSISGNVTVSNAGGSDTIAWSLDHSSDVVDDVVSGGFSQLKRSRLFKVWTLVRNQGISGTFVIAYASNQHFCPGEIVSLYASQEVSSLKYFAPGDEYTMTSPLATPALTLKAHDVPEWAEEYPNAYIFPIPDLDSGDYYIVAFTNSGLGHPVSPPLPVNIPARCDGGSTGGDGEIDNPVTSMRRVIRIEQPDTWPEGSPCLLVEYRTKLSTTGSTWGDWISARNATGGLSIMRPGCGPVSFNVSTDEVLPTADLETRLVESSCDDECDGLSTFTGVKVVPALESNAEVEVTIDHSDQGTFSICEYPQITAPAGIRVIVLDSRSNGDFTDGSRFCLLIENISWEPSEYHPDIDLGWTRTGEAG